MYEAFKKTKIESEGGQYRAAVIVITLLVILSVMSASYVCAAESGTAYLATATPYYKHPVTGKIEDPGQNEGIGQGMTESSERRKRADRNYGFGKILRNGSFLYDG